MTATGIAQSAEQYALGILRRHRDSMSRPDFQDIADDSALTAREVQELWEKLLADRAPKAPRPAAGHPRTDLPPSATVATPARLVEAPPSWLSAKDHPSARIRGKYKRAIAAVADLEAALVAEQEKEKLREKEARLAAQLAKVRAEIRGASPMPRDPKPAADLVACPDCGDMVTSGGMGVHRSRSKKHRADT